MKKCSKHVPVQIAVSRFTVVTTKGFVFAKNETRTAPQTNDRFQFHKSVYAIIWLKNTLKHENKYKTKENNNELDIREMNARVSIRPKNTKSV